MSYNKETGMYEGYIYKIYNDVNDKIYIGQTIRTINERWKAHIIKSKTSICDTYFHQAVYKHGYKNFHIVLIEKLSNDSKDKLLECLNSKEIYYINKYNSLRPFGYNTSKGGNNLPNTFTEKCVYQFNVFKELIGIYESMSEASKLTNTQQSDISKCCNGLIKSANGYIWSFSKELDDDAYCGQTPIDVYTLDGIFIETLMKQSDAQKYTTSKNISKICSGKQKQSNGYVFRYHGEPYNLYSTIKNTNSKAISIKVNQYDKDDVFIQTFNSVTLAGVYLDINNSTSISKCCKGKLKTAYGYKWFYANDPNQPDKTKIIA